MNPKYAAHIKLPFDLDMRGDAVFTCNQRKLSHTIKNPAEIDSRLIQFLAQRNMLISHAESFYTPPKSELPIHVDNDRLSDLAKMNFVYGAKGSIMQWWKLKDDEAPCIVNTTSVGTKYIAISKDQVDLVETAHIQRPTLVNVGQPHSVSNPTPYMRWCLSLVLWGHDVKRDLTIHECINRFSEFVV